MNTLFVTGTDTGVGKTTVSAAIVAALRARGLDLGVMKPVETGCPLRHGKRHPPDAHHLRAIAGVLDDMSLICPFPYATPVAPAVAALEEGRPVRFETIQAAARTLESRHQALLIEGAGGVMVPLDDRHTVRDLIRYLDARAVVVARAELGTLNHTLLTVKALQSEGVPVVGIVLNQGAHPATDASVATNAAQIAHWTGVPVWGMFPHLMAPEHHTLAAAAAATLDLEAIHRAFIPSSEGRAAALEASDKRHLWHPFTQMADFEQEPTIIIERADGSTLYDVHGNAFLDGTSSIWVTIHGHRHPTINRAIADQLTQLDHSTMLGLGNVRAIELAERLVAIAPPGLTRVFYSDNGSTAVEAALKMAFQYWRQQGNEKKQRFAALGGAYHGDTLGAVSVGGIDTFHHVFQPLLFSVDRVMGPDCYRCPLGKRYPDCRVACLDDLERTFAEHGDELAGLILEPLIQGAAGMKAMPPGYLKRARELCDQHEVFLILDEVATGFGRTGTMFACEQEGVTPDLMAIAKGLTGGYLPLAATLATERIYEGFLGSYDELKTFFHGHSYTGNPLACAAALASLKVFEDESTLEALRPKIAYLTERLAELRARPHVGDVRQRGFIAGIELVQDRTSHAPYPWDQKMGLRVCQEARQRGAMLRPIGNVLVVMPPLAISEADLARLMDIIDASIVAVTEGP